MTVSPPPPPPIAKRPLSSVSKGPTCKNIVRGTSYVVGMNPGVWFEDVLYTLRDLKTLTASCLERLC